MSFLPPAARTISIFMIPMIGFTPNWVARIRETISKGRYDAIFTEVSSFIDNKIHREKVVGLSALVSGEDLIRFCLQHAMLVPSGTYRRETIQTLGGYRTDLWQSEDYEFHARLAMSHPTYAVIDEALVHIHLRPESRSQNHYEVWSCRLKALRLLSKDLPEQYKSVISGAAITIGSKLFQMGCRTTAKEAFHLAEELGPPEYDDQIFLYRQIATHLGPETAEWLGMVYRSVLPDTLRRWARKAKG